MLMQMSEDLDQWKSTTGYVFTVTESVVNWKAKLQDTVTLSTTETGYGCSWSI